ncbi:MAG: YdcF family protein [Asticcacaulis sp.]|uniref:YdcF family protein n=1 Tax=Asticcacaulis sp. TaxID=1872648 RepID=UPI0039E61973
MAISRFLFVNDPPEAVDLAFVCCSPTVSSLAPALALYQSGLTRRILISGAGMTREKVVEWQLYHAHALAAGVPEDAILLEKAARNTGENGAFGATLIAAELGWGQVNTVAVCAKPFHMRRAVMTLRKYFPSHVRLIAQPPNDPGDLSAETWWQTEAGRQRVLGELGKISEYALKGDLGDV